jgi:hypothetical protein
MSEDDPDLPALRAKLDEAVRAQAASALRYMLVGAPVSLGVPEMAAGAGTQESLNDLCTAEDDVIATLHSVIPDTGQQPWSEALEHLLEHLIMRKQQQVDFLRRALGEA